MKTEGSYHLPASQRDAQAEVQRLAVQARSGWEKEARTLSLFGLKDGMSVLEPGSGPGFTTGQLVTLVPNSSVTCLEIDRTLLDQAEQYLNQTAESGVVFVEGSVMEMPFDESRFDFAYARFLFQHLPDPTAAAKEIWRVLKPGGRLVISDIDDALFGLFEPPIPELAPVLDAFGLAQAARGGNRYVGRSLPAMLDATGFCAIDLEVLGSHSADRGIESFLPHLSPDRMHSLVESGFLSGDDLERYRAALCAWVALPDAYTLWLSLMICAQKPYV